MCEGGRLEMAGLVRDVGVQVEIQTLLQDCDCGISDRCGAFSWSKYVTPPLIMGIRIRPLLDRKIALDVLDSGGRGGLNSGVVRLEARQPRYAKTNVPPIAASPNW